jgi:ATP-dependent protease ClpP protease subunit
MNTLNPTSWKAWAKSFPAQADKEVPYKSPFTIVNKGSDKEDAEILLYDVIGRDWWSGEGWAANDFAEKLKEIDPKAKLVIGINSPGGNVDDGLAIFNMLQRRGNVTTRNDGMAASIASVILQAGDTRQSAESAMVMIHKAWSVFAGNADDSRKFADILDKHDQLIAETYSRRSGKPIAGWMDMMKDESWFTGNEAKGAGLVDEIHQPAKKNLAAQSSLPSQQRPKGTSQADDSAATLTTPKASADGRGAVSAPAFSASAVAVADGQLTAAKQTKTKETNSMPESNTPAVANPPADHTAIIDAIKAGFADIKNTATANTLPGAAPLTGTHRVELGDNAAVKQFRNIKRGTNEFKNFVQANYGTLTRELPGAGIYNANTVDSGLANSLLSNDAIQTMRTYLAPVGAFTKSVELSPLSKRQVINVPLISSSGSMQTNPTNFETGDTTAADVAVTVNQYSKSWSVSHAEGNLGLKLAQLAPTNAKVIAEGIWALVSAKMTAALYGAGTAIGAAADFSATDLQPILALAKNYDRATLLLDGGHLAYLLPTDRQSFAFGEAGAYGFDGGIYKNNLWTGAIANTAGFVCGPDALVIATGQPANLPSGEYMTQETAEIGGGLSVTVTTWFSRGSRAMWGSFDVMFGVKEGDTTQAEVLITS